MQFSSQMRFQVYDDMIIGDINDINGVELNKNVKILLKTFLFRQK